MTLSPGAETILRLRRIFWEDGGSWQRVSQETGITGQALSQRWGHWVRKEGLAEPLLTSPIEMSTSIEETKQPEDDWMSFHHQVDLLPSTYRIAFLTDIHMPDHDMRAVELALRIVSDFKPHVLPHGSDVFDLPTISRFESDPEDEAEDVWQAVNQPYLKLMRSVNDASADAWRPFIVGNHDARVWAFLTRLAPQFRHTISKLVVDTIRKADGLWLGWDTSEIALPGMLLAHGQGIVSGMYPARKLADYCATQESALAGHVHKFDNWSKRGSQGIVTYQTSGCLCQLQPKWSHRRQNWQHGIVLATVVNGVAFFTPVPFVDYVAIWGDKEYRG